MQGEETMEQAGSRLWRSILAAAAGNVLEWYDFTVYAYMAPYIAEKFFPGSDPVAGLLAVFATFGLGFVIRPLGGILIGRWGDTWGRKSALLFTIVLMAVGTAGIGLVPGYDAIGGLAPWLLVLCRLLQGFSAGGEWGSSTAFIYEWAPKGRRSFFSSLQQSSVAGGMLLGSAVVSAVSADELTSAANVLQSRTFRAFEVYAVVLAMYLVMATLFRLVFRLAYAALFERRGWS